MKRNLELCARTGMFILLLTPSAGVRLSAQELKDISFNDQSITDILQVLTSEINVTVLADETINGKTTFLSPSLEPRRAIELLLEQEGLFGFWEDSVLRVSRISLQKTDSGLISLEASEAEVQHVVTALAKLSETTILFDALPGVPISIRAEALNVKDILEMVVRRIPGIRLEEDNRFFYVRKIDVGTDDGVVGSEFPLGFEVTKDGDLYGVEIEHGQFSDIMKSLFEKSEQEYSFLYDSDLALSDIRFNPRPFNDLLTLLCEHTQAGYTKAGNLYYIYDPRQEDVLAKYSSVIRRTMEHIDVARINPLLPSGLVGSGTVKIDEEANSLLLFGTLEKLVPLLDFLDTIDVPRTERKWTRLDLNFLSPENLAGVLPADLSMLEILPVPGTSSVVAAATATQIAKLTEFLQVADHSEEGRPIRLRYMKSDDLISNLPPSFSEKDISKTQDPSLIFFRGTEDRLFAFRRVLDSMDRPVPQIRYDLLVINYQDTRGFQWNKSNISIGPDSAAGTAFSGTFSPLLDMNFDIAMLGYQFALKLSASLEETSSKVVADTTLNGLSGEKVSFRNTNTYRYRDYRIDPTTGKQVSEGSREITSGLIVDVEGWVSGDGMITMNISATISRQLAAKTTSADILPPTTERVIKTNVRTIAGTPVIISGLTQQDTVLTEEKTPLIGDVPVLGWMFKKKDNKVEDTELIIYIVPHIEYGLNGPVDGGGLFERVYYKYIKGT